MLKQINLRGWKAFCIFAASSLGVGGCGTAVPSIGEAWDQGEGVLDGSGVLEKQVKEKVYCELRKAVFDVSHGAAVEEYKDGQKIDALPDDWGVQVTLNLQVDESTAVNPGVSFKTPMHSGIANFVGEYLGPSTVPALGLLSGAPAVQTFGALNVPQSYSLGLGGTISSQATRIDKFTFYYDVSKLKTKPPAGDSCIYPDGRLKEVARHGSSLLIVGNLGIPQWLINGLAVEHDYPSTPLTKNADTSIKQDILSYETKFIIKTSGNITPTWNLVRIAANQGNLPLAGVERLRTHDLTITFGPSQKPGTSGQKPQRGGPSEPTITAANAHLASQIGLSVSNNLRPFIGP
jgi:hypothetical protein